MSNLHKLVALGIILMISETAALLIVSLLAFDAIYFWAIFGLMMLTTLLFLAPMFPLSPVFTPDISSFHVKGPFLNRKIEYSEINSIRYGSFDIGMRVIGMYLGRGSLGGTFRNSEFGSYSITGKDRGPGTRYIIMTMKDGKAVAFNLKTEEDTVLAYELIKHRSGLHKSADTEPYKDTVRKPEQQQLYDRAKNVSRKTIVLSLALGTVVPLIFIYFYKGGTGISVLVPTVISIIVPLAAIIAYHRWFKDTGLPKTEKTGTLTVLGSQIAIVPILFAVAGFIIAPAVINTEVSDDYFAVSALMLDEKIYYEDITELSITEEKFRRDSGYGGTNISTGKFSNPTFGKVMYAAYNDVSIKIVVEHKDGTFVFNKNTEESTLEMFDFLKIKAGL